MIKLDRIVLTASQFAWCLALNVTLTMTVTANLCLQQNIPSD